jgi:lipid II:glycine glycyltransferase (peptidoglycan interpeptide bridge formation enzyme)
MAYVNDKKIGGLLVFCFNNTVEYFTPAIDEKFRTTQALSLVICYAMRDAALDGYTHWNWGGTWLSQGGVYDFKRKWGTIDKPYHYYTKIYKEKILNINRQIALEEYPFFYVAPFDQLRG